MSNNKILGWIGGIALILLIILIVDNGKPRNGPLLKEKENTDISESSSSPAKVNEAQPIAIPAPIEHWEYSHDNYKMSNKTTHYAQCKSIESFHLKSPYEGDTYLHILVRNKGNGNEVVLETDRGQILTSFGGERSMRVKFDDETPWYANYTGSNDGNSQLAWIVYSQNFLAKLKKAKKVIIEPTFFDDGTRQIEFDISGLKWEH